MKPSLLLVLLSLTTFSSASALTCISLPKTLLRYQSSSNVLVLQNFLASKGILTATPTGFFGKATLSAVKAYQTSIGISPTGNVGPLTRAAIKAETCNVSGVTSTNISSNGICGSSSGQSLTSTPTNLCTNGQPSTVSGAGTSLWTWTCTGAVTVGCSAYNVAPGTVPAPTVNNNGMCGISSGNSFSSTPTTNLCTVGVSSVPAGVGPWSWSCSSTDGGSTASCGAGKIDTTVPPTSGTCGSSNGTTVPSTSTLGPITTSLTSFPKNIPNPTERPGPCPIK